MGKKDWKLTNLESLLKAVYEFSITSIEHVRMLKHLAVASKQYELASELRGFEEDLIASQPKEELPEPVPSSGSVDRQELRYKLVVELIRSGKEDFLSLAHESEQFVLNGMENKPVDGPAESNSSWPQTNDEVISDGAWWIMRDASEAWKQKWEDTIRVARESLAGDDPEKNRTFDSLIQSEMFVQGGTVKFTPNVKIDPGPSIQEGFNEKWKVKDLPNGGWHIPNPELDASAESANKEMFKKLVLGNVEAPIDPSQEEVQGGGESAEPQMTLWEMCQAIFEDETGSNVLSDKGWILKHDMDNVFNLWDGNLRDAKLVLGENDFFISRETSDGNGVREILMGFPQFKK